jgi:CheY-like chemotaxis protein/nitrogen-specific signal transduction histidine kinase
LSVQDSSRKALDLVHRLLSLPAAAQPGLAELLAQLADAFGATGAGLAPLPPAAPAVRARARGQQTSSVPLPWESDPTLLAQLRGPGSWVVLPGTKGSLVATVTGHADGPEWLLWVEDESRTAWTPEETAALVLFGGACSLPVNPATVPRWAEFRERRLRQQRLDEAGRVVRRLAHDFGNVLTSILGFTELSLAQRIAPGNPLHEYLAEVHRGAQGAAEWTALLRLFGLRDPVTSRPGSLAGVVRAEEQAVRAVWNPAAELVLDLAPALPAAAAAEEHLRLVLHNLLENAYEALPASKGVVTLSARPLDLTAEDCLDYYGRLQPGPHVGLRVTDTGAGLTPDARRRLFAEPFFTTKPRRRGLGLAVAYGITAANRGGLRLENGPAGGAVAEVVFPAVRVEPAPAPPARAAAAPGPKGGPDGAKVLVVDDDPLVRRFVLATLQRAGYRVEAVATAEEALASYQADPRDPFRLVLSDLVMPQTTGIDLARRLRESDANARLLFMSGREGLEVGAKAVSVQPFQFIQKPFRSERLLQAVRSAIDTNRDPEATTRSSEL